jgi:hypothetical protein
MATGILFAVVAPALGDTTGYYGTHNGIATLHQNHVCTWCKW